MKKKKHKHETKIFLGGSGRDVFGAYGAVDSPVGFALVRREGCEGRGRNGFNQTDSGCIPSMPTCETYTARYWGEGLKSGRLYQLTLGECDILWCTVNIR